MQLTEHFSYEDLTHTDHREFDNTPTNAEKCIIDGHEVLVDAAGNLPRLAAFLEEVRVILGNKPIFVNSAFRSEDVNASVGSKNTSDHRRGCAADIRVTGMTPDEVCRALIASNLGYQQVIREFDRWTHVAMPTHAGDVPKKSKLIIDKQTPNGRPFA
jgi:zinc D-Ala-D-Ala carboxypeptidase